MTIGDFKLVYCTRCGTLNSDSAGTCQNCGAPLVMEPASRPYAYHEHHRHYEDREHHHGGAGIGLLIAGLFIVLIGVAAFAGISIWEFIWPLILIVIGIWVLTLGLRRNRRYRT